MRTLRPLLVVLTAYGVPFVLVFLLVRQWLSLAEFSLLANPFHIATAILATTFMLLLADIDDTMLVHGGAFAVNLVALVLILLYSAFPVFVFQLAGLKMPGTFVVSFLVFFGNLVLGLAYLGYGCGVRLLIARPKRGQP